MKTKKQEYDHERRDEWSSLNMLPVSFCAAIFLLSEMGFFEKTVKFLNGNDLLGIFSFNQISVFYCVLIFGFAVNSIYSYVKIKNLGIEKTSFAQFKSWLLNASYEKKIASKGYVKRKKNLFIFIFLLFLFITAIFATSKDLTGDMECFLYDGTLANHCTVLHLDFGRLCYIYLFILTPSLAIIGQKFVTGRPALK